MVDLGITLGDPAGIGPEIVAVVLAALSAEDRTHCRVFGDMGVLARAAGLRGIALPSVEIEEVTALGHDEARPGHPDAASARAQVAYLEAAVRSALDGEIGAIVTAPIQKAHAHGAGFSFPGQTEFLAARSGTTEYAMLLCGSRLRVVLATTHLALAEVPRELTPEAIARATVLLARALRDDLAIARPRIAVAALNPHAGEAGLFGDEEARIVLPGIEAARRRLEREGLVAQVDGPAVPDAVFRAAADGVHDGVVALYHDQGLIPVKLLEFDEAVNVTLGLPFVRTSPDHGVAYDLAGTGRARAASFRRAFDLAREMLARRRGGGAKIEAGGDAEER